MSCRYAERYPAFRLPTSSLPLFAKGTNMSFAIVAIATSIASLILGVGWLFAGSLVLKRWGIEANALSLLVGRRIGAVYLGFSLMFLSISRISRRCRSR